MLPGTWTAHDQEKWIPVFRKDHAQLKRQRALPALSHLSVNGQRFSSIQIGKKPQAPRRGIKGICRKWQTDKAPE
jgi:hypothetical protein